MKNIKIIKRIIAIGMILSFVFNSQIIINANEITNDVSYLSSVPSFNITGNAQSFTNQNIVLTLLATNPNSDFKYIELPNGNRISELSTMFTVSQNGSYSFRAYYENSKSITKTIQIINIDKVKPIIQLNNNTNWSNINEQINIKATDY